MASSSDRKTTSGAPDPVARCVDRGVFDGTFADFSDVVFGAAFLDIQFALRGLLGGANENSLAERSPQTAQRGTKEIKCLIF